MRKIRSPIEKLLSKRIKNDVVISHNSCFPGMVLHIYVVKEEDINKYKIALNNLYKLMDESGISYRKIHNYISINFVDNAKVGDDYPYLKGINMSNNNLDLLKAYLLVTKNI